MTGPRVAMAVRVFWIAVVFVMLVGCGESESTRSRNLLAAVRQYVEALPGGDVDVVLATMHPDSEEFVGMRQTVARLSEIGVTFKLEKAKVTESEDEEATVRVVIRADGPESFRSCRLTELGVLRRDGGRWKVFATQVEQVEYLDVDEDEEGQE